MLRYRSVVPISAVLAGLTLASAAPAFQVLVRVDRTQLAVGQVAIVKLCILHAKSEPEVRPPEVADVYIAPLGKPILLGHSLSTDRLNAALEATIRRITESGLEGRPAKPAGEMAKEHGREFDVLKAPMHGDFVAFFKVQPEKTGTFTIPGFTVIADNQTAVTEPITLYVSPSGQPAGVRFEASLSNARPAMNEDVQLFL